MAETVSKSRSILKPVVGGLVLIGAIVAIIAFRSQLWDLLKSAGNKSSNTLVNWVPNHPGATLAIVVALLVAFGINWIAHVAGRLRAWIFALVVEAGLWVLFWNSIGIPSLKELFGLDSLEQISANEQVISGLVVIILAGVIFWFLEARENWNSYRRKHNPDDN